MYLTQPGFIQPNQIVPLSGLIPLDYEKTRQRYDQEIGSTVDGGRAVLFGAPVHSNVGDLAILLGACDYLRSIHDDLVIVKEYSQFEVSRSDIVYFMGGGNFGDYYAGVHLDKIRRLRTLRSNKVVFLPQSVYFRRRRIIAQTRRALDEYDGQVDFFVRDMESKRIIENRCNVEAKLLPDSSLLLQPRLKVWTTGVKSEGVVYIRRNDKESEVRFNFPGVPTFDLMHVGIPDQPELSVRVVTQLLSVRKVVISDRLHGAILVSLIGNHSILLPNSYHKNRSFYETWALPGMVFASTKQEVINYVKSLTDLEIAEYCDVKTWVGNRAIKLGYRYLT